MRATLLARVRELLGSAGFYLNAEGAMRPLSFDVVARRDGELLLVKVLANVDGLTEPVAKELTTIAQFLEATPLVIGERSSSRELEPGAVYARHGIRIIAAETLRDYLVEGVEPLVYAAPGGFYVNIDGQRLRALREERGLSLGDVAQAAGVSRRAVGMYEEGMSAMVDVAMRLEQFLDEALARPIDPFRPEPLPEPDLAAAHAPFPAGFEGAMLGAMREMGFRVAPTTRAPFAAISKESGDRVQESVVLTGIVTDAPDVARRAAATANLCEVTETFGVFFVERTTTRVALEGTPVVSREEMTRLDDPGDLLELLKARRGRAR